MKKILVIMLMDQQGRTWYGECNSAKEAVEYARTEKAVRGWRLVGHFFISEV